MLHQTLGKFGRVKVNEPLAKHTTYKIGGPAELMVVVEETEKLIELLRFLDGEGIPRFILGGGSNFLPSDEGMGGVVIKIKTQTMSVTEDKIVADAGCVTVAIAQASMQHGLTGFEWGVGVPGTIGGAVRGNAGAMGAETKDSVASVLVYADGEVLEYNNAECKFGYRDSIFKHSSAVVLQVTLQLQKSEDKELMKKALEFLQYRNKTQPQGFANGGSVFKNVDPGEAGVMAADLLAKFPGEEEKINHFFSINKISAGWLVEMSGLKGVKIGGAGVSEKHGNFINNDGTATASDVRAVIDLVKETVAAKTGVALEEEIQLT